MADQPKKKVKIVAKKRSSASGGGSAAAGAASGSAATDPTAAAAAGRAGEASEASRAAPEAASRGIDKGGLLDLRRILDFPAGVAEQAREVWMAGIGALSTVEEAGQAIFDELVKKGEKWERDSRKRLTDARLQAESAADRAKAAAQDLGRVPAEFAAGAEAQVQRMVEDTVEGVLHRLGVPTHDEVRELIGRVELLSEKVDALMTKLQQQADVARGPAPAAPPDEREELRRQAEGSTATPPASEGTVYHVMPSAEGWSVQREGTTRASSSHGTKSDAVAAGRELARKHAPSSLVVYRQDGTIQNRFSYEAE